MVDVIFTAARFTEESIGMGLPAETGWIDPNWSMKEIVDFEESESIIPQSFDDEDEAIAYIESVIGYVTRDGDNFYAEDEDMDLITGDRYSYTANITKR